MVYCRIIAIDKTETQSWGEVTDPQRNRHQVTSDPPVCRSHRSKKKWWGETGVGGGWGVKSCNYLTERQHPPRLLAPLAAVVVSVVVVGRPLRSRKQQKSPRPQKVHFISCEKEGFFRFWNCSGRNMALLLLLLLPLIASGLKLTPPENIWVRHVFILTALWPKSKFHLYA